jgi:hypothetical protein
VKRMLVALVIGLASSWAFAVTFIPIEGDISVTTSPNLRSAAVTISNQGSVIAQFCLSFPQPLKESIALSERGQVVYLPQPIEGLPPGAQIRGPEPIAQTLTVIPEKGPAFAFVAKGVKPIYKNAKPIEISSVSRQDWMQSNNKRRVPGVEACTSAGG